MTMELLLFYFKGIGRVKVCGIVQEMPYRIIESEEMESIHDESSHKIRKEIEQALEQNKLLGGGLQMKCSNS